MSNPIALLGYVERPQQKSAEVVCIETWLVNEEYEVYPVGSKPKRLVVSPVHAAEPFIVPGHNHLFKVSTDFRQQQLWSEIIAYELSRHCGVEVPPCFVAVDQERGECGVLMEFFFGYFPPLIILRAWRFAALSAGACATSSVSAVQALVMAKST